MTPEVCRAARESLGWSADKLARVAGLSRPTVEHFEDRRRQPRAGTLIALRRALSSAGATSGS